MPLNSLRDTLMTKPSCRSYFSCNLLISSLYLLGIRCGTVFSLTPGQSLTWRSDIELSFLSDDIIFFIFIHISSFRGIWTAKQTFFDKRGTYLKILGVIWFQNRMWWIMLLAVYPNVYIKSFPWWNLFIFSPCLSLGIMFCFVFHFSDEEYKRVKSKLLSTFFREINVNWREPYFH